MNLRLIFSLALGAGTLAAMAQGYQDGVDYYNADRFEEAAIILNNTLSQPGTNQAVSHFYLGNLDLRDGNTQAAAANFNKGVSANPNYGFNYIGLGEIALKSGDKAGAEKLFKQALATDKKDASLYARIARAYFNTDPVKYAKEIEKNIEKGMKINSANSDIYVLQGDMVRLTDIGEAAGKYEQAMVYDEENGHINPEAYVKYANLYNKANPDFSITKLEELAQKLPESALAQRELAEKYYDGNRLTKAAHQYGIYMANPNHFQKDEQRYSGLLYFSKDYPKSLEIAQAVLAKDPDNLYMHRMVMLNKAALEDWTGAEEAAEKLFAAPGAEFTSTDYMTRGDILSGLEKAPEAIEWYLKAYQLNPEKNREVLSSISATYSDAEDYAKAAEYMQKFVDSGESTLQDYFTLSNRYKNLAITLPEGSKERTEAANNGIKYIDLALETAATRVPLLRNRATLLLARDGASKPTKEVAEAYEALVAEMDLDPENAEKYHDVYRSAYSNIGSYYINNGQKDKGKQAYLNMLKFDPDNAGLKQYIKTL